MSVLQAEIKIQKRMFPTNEHVLYLILPDGIIANVRIEHHIVINTNNLFR